MPKRSTLGHRFLLLLEQGVGDEVHHLVRIVGIGAAEGRGGLPMTVSMGIFLILSASS